ncbi:MAG: hypothetical protein ACK53V_10800, partial [Planctomycetota bacterium]
MKLDHCLIKSQDRQVVSRTFGRFRQSQPAPIQIALPKTLMGLFEHLPASLAASDHQASHEQQGEP